MTPAHAHDNYEARISAEKSFFQDNVEVHGDLPPIFHYWSNRWLRPKLNALGFDQPNQLFENYLFLHCSKAPEKIQRFVSIGAGNCELEVPLVAGLAAKGYSNLLIDCVDLNPSMLARGRAYAEQKGVAAQFNFVEADFNEWRAEHAYDVVLANHSLHHVVNLEGLFEQIHSSLAAGGHFVVADMIGRNGHQRWPEALQIVQEFWKELPSEYRRNVPLKRVEDEFGNWDCSVEGFEGIRAQDIMPLLLKHFHFEMFLGFSNVIVPFVDRAFGHNFNAEREWDRDFIDRVHLRDELEMKNGRIKPTQMYAVMSNSHSIPTQYVAPLSPEFSVRWPDESPAGGHLDEIRREELRLRAQLEQSLHELRIENNELKERLQEAQHKIGQARSSKWLRLGQQFGLGPRLE